ncbi:helix-turn-helix transcriptional regulator [Flavobacterium sp. MMLR14_040]|uniref:helix-turn-helix domain-containing protein n=1 Tax=Flavobacterium sp. MMLR14_040 TaxID=3093843 RepID=UPI00298FA137|nr:helix-turn-helix transcriptional regulator [Flavobacterium sp. MMLR14_040]MDW8850112.1 helix-turn-helix transcriptional regulator [Flavobacterium sp. MMLR14_040]
MLLGKTLKISYINYFLTQIHKDFSQSFFTLIFCRFTLCYTIRIRTRAGISQTDLATQLGIHKNVLEKHERNEVFPSIDIARKIADIVDVSLYFLTHKENV